MHNPNLFVYIDNSNISKLFLKHIVFIPVGGKVLGIAVAEMPLAHQVGCVPLLTQVVGHQLSV